MPSKNEGVGYSNDEYNTMFPDWDLVEDVIAGQTVIKEKAEQYLPWPVSQELDASLENETRYNNYLERALFYAATKRTLHGLVGEVFRSEPVVEYTNEDLMPMIVADTDGMGVTLVQHSKRTLKDILSKGRCGLLVDYPITEGETTKQQQQDLGIRPVIVRYDASQIINWRSKAVGSENRISLVVIHEWHQEPVDDETFEPIVEERWKELRLTDSNQYIIRHWKWDEAKEEFYQEGETIEPANGAGQPMDHIPFTFVGSENNDQDADQPPLLDLASINIAHYRNSADYEESVFITGQPTPWVAGLTEEWARDILGDNIQLGSRSLLPLPDGGSAGLIQADPNNLVGEAMKHKEEQMVKLGAKLIEAATVARTATEAKITEASENSILSTAASNVSQAYTTCFGFIYEFLDLEFDPDTEYFELSKDYEVHNLEPNAQKQLVASWMAGAITDEEMRDSFRRAGVAFLDDDEWREKNEEQILNKGLPDGDGDGDRDGDGDED